HPCGSGYDLAVMKCAPLAAVVLLAGCAARAPAAAEPEVAPFEERLASNVLWQPGDLEPVARDVVGWAAADEGAALRRLAWHVQIRDRCCGPGGSAVGPGDEAAPADAPQDELAPGEALSSWIPEGAALHLRDSGGGASVKAKLAAKH